MLGFCVQGRTKQIRILVVDDEPDVRLMFRIGLGREPEIEVTGEAADGAEAVALVSENCPDAVLLDIRMPGMDRLEAAGHIRQACPQIKILVISAHPVSQSTKDAIAKTADLFLDKTTPIHRVKEAVLRLCA